jgi:hypothetical protein
MKCVWISEGLHNRSGLLRTSTVNRIFTVTKRFLFFQMTACADTFVSVCRLNNGVQLIGRIKTLALTELLQISTLCEIKHHK